MNVIVWSTGLVTVIRDGKHTDRLQGNLKDVGWSIIEESEKIEPETTEYSFGDENNGIVKSDYFRFKMFVERNFPKVENVEK